MLKKEFSLSFFANASHNIKNCVWNQSIYLTLKNYINNGWLPLNKVKTGGIGYSNTIWTYEKCKVEALKYNNRTILKEEAPVVYKTIYSNK